MSHHTDYTDGDAQVSGVIGPTTQRGHAGGHVGDEGKAAG
jgi:hypothetical protein